MAKKNKNKKEEIAEGICFVCKDGGFLIVCDYKDCLKAYHPRCVGRDDSFADSGDRWTCDWHSCFICHKKKKFHCFCCPTAVCGHCLCDAEFACVRATKGFCHHCLKLAQLIEDNLDTDADGVKIDFRDRDTYECLFKEYWEIIKEKEGLTSEHVHSADGLLKKNKNYWGGSDPENGEGKEDDGDFEEESDLIVSDYDDLNDVVENKAVGKRKRSMGKSKKKEFISTTKKKAKSKKKEFIGWGSRTLLEFLGSIDEDPTQELSQYDVATLITNYCRENNLFHPEKRKKVLCDERLQSLFSRKSLNKNSIYKLLTAHFAENFEQMEEYEYGSKEKDDNVLFTTERKKKWSLQRTSPKQSPPVVQRSCFASIVVENIKLIYLKRSLVEELLKQPETFEGKVIGCFVRVKSDPHDYLQKNTHQLLQVTGIKRASTDGETLLQVSSHLADVSISKLADDDFSEDECKDLSQRVKGGLLRKLTVVELEQKASSLHEDIMKHWITRELLLLQHRIDLANEKGWRREYKLSEYMDRKLLLQTPSEQSRLLHEIPDVIADVPELEPAFGDSVRTDKQGQYGFAELVRGTSKLPSTDLKGSGTSCSLDAGTDPAVAPVKGLQYEVSTPEKKEQQSEEYLCEKSTKGFHCFTHDVKDDDILQREHQQLVQNVKQHHFKAGSLPEELPEESLTFTVERESDLLSQKHSHAALSGGKQNQPVDSEEMKEKRQITSMAASMGCSDDGILQREHHESVQEVEQQCPRSSPVGKLPQKCLTSALEGQCDDYSQKVGDERKQNVSTEKIIELSDDDGQDPSLSIRKQAVESFEGSIWHCVGPCGERRGPLSMSLLKRWSETSSYALDFKVWRTGQSQQDAIFLIDALRQNVEELPRKSLMSALGGQSEVVSQNVGLDQTTEKKQNMSKAKLITLSDDDGQDHPSLAMRKQAAESSECSTWYCMGPNGERRGPLSMSVLKRWKENSSYASMFKVWKTGQSQQDAIFLDDALC